MSIASPPVFAPGFATQTANTARAACDTSSEVAMANDLPGLNSKSTVQSPCTANKSDRKVVILENITRQRPYHLSVEMEGQRPKSVGLHIVRQILIFVYCV